MASSPQPSPPREEREEANILCLNAAPLTCNNDQAPMSNDQRMSNPQSLMNHLLVCVYQRCTGQKAPEDWRSPRRLAAISAIGGGASFWTAPVLWRFLSGPAALNTGIAKTAFDAGQVFCANAQNFS